MKEVILLAIQIYANLLGEWVNLTEDDACKIGSHLSSPTIWWEENAEIWYPFNRENEHTMYQMSYVHISYKGKDYRIHPIHIQIVES